jgi:tetratricopeptide (TPR) repeat protein
MSEISREDWSVKAEVSFINFLKHQKYVLLIISGIYIGIYFLLVYLYPYPNGLDDAGYYVKSALYRKVDIYYPFGYSRFLIFLHAFSSSISFVVIVQFVLNALASVFFIFTIKYFFRFNNKYPDYIYYFLSIFSVSVLYLTDTLMSESLLTSLTIIWITLGIWFGYIKSIGLKSFVFSLHIVLLLILMSIKYTGIFYPLITVIIVLLTLYQKSKLKSFAICIVPIITFFLFYYIQTQKNKERTGIEIFLPLSGWQMATNALNILPYIKLDTSEIPDKEVREFTEFAVKYTPLIESEPLVRPTPVFIWYEEMPLRQFLWFKIRQNHNSSFDKTWTYLSKSVYRKFGTYIMIHYPFSYLRYYLIPNLLQTLYPPAEFFNNQDGNGVANRGKELLKDWFHLDKDLYSTNSDIIKNNSKFLRIYRLIIWILFFSVIFYSFFKREKIKLKIFQVKIFWIILIFILTYFAFSVFSAPCQLRYLAPIHLLQITIIYILLNSLFQVSDSRDQTSDNIKLVGFAGKIITSVLIFTGILIIATQIYSSFQSQNRESVKWNQVCFKASGDQKKLTWFDYQGALDDYLSSIKLQPNYTEAYIGTGSIYFIFKNYQTSIEEFNKAIGINPNLAEAYLKRAASYAAINNIIKSMEDLNKAIVLAPDYSEAFSSRGSLKVKMNDFNGAFEDFNKAIALNPYYKNSFLSRGKLKFSLNDNKGAIEDFDKAISLDPQFKKAYISRSFAKAKMNNYNGAIEDADKAIDIDPETAECYFNRGVIKEYMKDFKGALQDLDISIALDLQSEMAFYYRGFAKSNMFDNAGALEDLNKAITLNPNNAKAIFLRGNIYFNLQNNIFACIDWNSALKLGLPDAQNKIERYCK